MRVPSFPCRTRASRHSASRQAISVIDVIGGFSDPALSVGQRLAEAQVEAVTVKRPLPNTCYLMA